MTLKIWKSGGRRTSRQWTTFLLWAMIILSSLPLLDAHRVSADSAVPIAQTEQTYSFNISSGPLSLAIDEFIRITNWQVGYGADLTQGVVSSEVIGHYSAREHWNDY